MSYPRALLSGTGSAHIRFMHERFQFRVAWPLSGYFLGAGEVDSVTIDVPPTADGASVRVEIRPSEADGEFPNLQVIAATSARMNSANAIAMEALPRDGRLYLDEVPDGLRSAFENVTRRLRAAARIAVETWRWRFALTGPPLRLSEHWIQVSQDGSKWRTCIPSKTASAAVSLCPLITKAMSSETTQCLADATGEPAAHDLFREAMSLLNENPRASLVVAVSALEIGIKELIAALVPDAEWMIRNAPAAPVEQLLRDLLPRLPVKMRFEGRHLRPNDATLRSVREVVERRNALVHRGETVEVAFVRERASTIRHLLRLFDYYAGHEWAGGYVDQNILET